MEGYPPSAEYEETQHDQEFRQFDETRRWEGEKAKILEEDNRRRHEKEVRYSLEEDRRIKYESRRREDNEHSMTLIQLLSAPKKIVPDEPHITASPTVSPTPTAISTALTISTAKPAAPTISTAASTVPVTTTHHVQSPFFRNHWHRAPTVQADATYLVFQEWHRHWNDFSKMVDLQKIPREKTHPVTDVHVCRCTKDTRIYPRNRPRYRFDGK
ncbi:hypothetical protein SK128_010192 [Halocaridina rubra]|uniref:Uncharacterized protein n=1 Tax=Halocaridina rubra TaxID=373956 RepID=A0AAN8X8G8_HALRR